jgi:hypothetical protein
MEYVFRKKKKRENFAFICSYLEIGWRRLGRDCSGKGHGSSIECILAEERI